MCKHAYSSSINDLACSHSILYTVFTLKVILKQSLVWSGLRGRRERVLARVEWNSKALFTLSIILTVVRRGVAQLKRLQTPRGCAK
jgi:hypothetical protein